MTYIGIIITYVFISNLILSQFLGLCPFIGVSKNVESAVGMGFAVTFVMSIASLVTWALYHLILMASWAGISADNCFYPYNRFSSSACGDGSSEILTHPLQSSGNLSSPDYH